MQITQHLDSAEKLSEAAPESGTGDDEDAYLADLHDKISRSKSKFEHRNQVELEDKPIIIGVAVTDASDITFENNNNVKGVVIFSRCHFPLSTWTFYRFNCSRSFFGLKT